MKRSLSKLLIASFIVLSACSSTLPTQVIEPKMNGVKINQTFKNISSMSIDSDDNLYIIDNNVIKRLDSKTDELTIIAGKENPDTYPEDGNIDGDVSTAKFGTISQVFYIKSESAIYFIDSLKGGCEYFLRKITSNNVKTIFSSYESFNNCDVIVSDKSTTKVGVFDVLKNKADSIYLMPMSIKSGSSSFIIDKLQKVNYKDNNYSFVDILTNLNEEKNRYFFIDNEETLYSISYSEDRYSEILSVRINNKWKKIFQSQYKIYFDFDNNNNLYIIRSIQDVVVKPPDYKYKREHYPSINLYKISKSKISEINSPIGLDDKDKSYAIGELEYYSRNFQVSNDGTKAYIEGKDSLVKVNIGVKK